MTNEHEMELLELAERYVKAFELEMKARQQAWESINRTIQTLGPMLPALLGLIKP